LGAFGARREADLIQEEIGRERRAWRIWLIYTAKFRTGEAIFRLARDPRL
jgi:hypothetical protein